MMLPIIAAVAQFITVHMWYENACCGGMDCKPVADGVVEDRQQGVEVNGFGLLSYSDPRLRWSQDNSDHLCVSNSTMTPKLVCVYRRFKGI